MSRTFQATVVILLGNFGQFGAVAAISIGSYALSGIQELGSKIDSGACSAGPFISQSACLAKNYGECMWVELDKRNLCLPCTWYGTDVPCVPEGVVLPQGVVSRCEMACPHQKLITAASPCTDVSGNIPMSDCQAKGEASGTRCIWTEFTTKMGKKKNLCGPCNVPGTGIVPPYTPGGPGPEDGSEVIRSWSQCQVAADSNGIPCDPTLGIPAVNPCRPTPPPTLPGGLPPPVPLEKMGFSVQPGAPNYIGVPVAAPYDENAFLRAAAAAARVAGWPAGSLLPPSVPVNVVGLPPAQGPKLPSSMAVKFMPAPPPGLVTPPVEQPYLRGKPAL